MELPKLGNLSRSSSPAWEPAGYWRGIGEDDGGGAGAAARHGMPWLLLFR